MRFDAQRTLASIGYLANKTGANLGSIMDMLYLADKEHLGQFGRTITGDEYLATQMGPVPERAREMCRFVAGDRDFFDPMPAARRFMRIEHAPGRAVELLADPDLDQLSPSDLQCLACAASVFLDHGENGAVADASHDKAWTQAWAQALSSGADSMPMRLTSIAATLHNASAVIGHIKNPQPGRAASSSKLSAPPPRMR